ncbi:MAG TPA: PEP-CTERM sorting domain-containing protein [Burkholderiales bacterium]|nr:PEP-CTERM sorting domain-containing protein [Burkholderiales bacterium]
MFARKATVAAVSGAIALLVGSGAYAAVQTFSTPTGATVLGNPVNASASFTTSTGVLQITLTDLLSNPTTVSQLVSDLDFTLSVGGTSTLTSSSGQEITISNTGSATLGSTVSTGWVLGSYNGGLTLCVICPVGSNVSSQTAPAHLIIGPGPYTNANGSIAGNDPHNPFLNGSATFSIANSSITSGTTVSNVVFSFGTTPGLNVPAVPEPGSLALLGSGLLALGGIGRRKRLGMKQ